MWIGVGKLAPGFSHLPARLQLLLVVDQSSLYISIGLGLDSSHLSWEHTCGYSSHSWCKAIRSSEGQVELQKKGDWLNHLAAVSELNQDKLKGSDDFVVFLRKEELCAPCNVLKLLRSTSASLKLCQKWCHLWGRKIRASHDASYHFYLELGWLSFDSEQTEKMLTEKVHEWQHT